MIILVGSIVELHYTEMISILVNGMMLCVFMRGRLSELFQKIGHMFNERGNCERINDVYSVMYLFM